MPNTSVRAAAEGMPAATHNRRTILAMGGSGLAAALLGASVTHVKASPAPQASKLLGLEAAFLVELKKLQAMEPEHNAAERRYFEEHAKLVEPVMREQTAAEREAIRKMTLAELYEWRRPGRPEFDEAVRAYEKSERAIRRRTGFTKIDRAYHRQVGRVSDVTDRIIRCPARSFDDLALKARVHKVWGFDESDLECIMRDIGRIVRNKAGAA